MCPLDVTIVIPNANSYCDHGDAETLFLTGMKSHWLPLAFSDVGLLCGLLLAACRHLLIAGPAVNKEYAGMALLYKGECIKSTNQAVVTEGTSVSDATIGKALIMSSDEVRSLGKFLTHSHLLLTPDACSFSAETWRFPAFMQTPLSEWSH